MAAAKHVEPRPSWAKEATPLQGGRDIYRALKPGIPSWKVKPPQRPPPPALTCQQSPERRDFGKGCETTVTGSCDNRGSGINPAPSPEGGTGERYIRHPQSCGRQRGLPSRPGPEQIAH